MTRYADLAGTVLVGKSLNGFNGAQQKRRRCQEKAKVRKGEGEKAKVSEKRRRCQEPFTP
jgi:uncharacterized membrane protein